MLFSSARPPGDNQECEKESEMGFSMSRKGRLCALLGTLLILALVAGLVAPVSARGTAKTKPGWEAITATRVVQVVPSSFQNRCEWVSVWRDGHYTKVWKC